MKFLTNLTLGKKIAFLTTVGLLFGVGVFSFLGMRAVNRATETMLQDRLTTAGLVADYLDEALGRAVNEVKNTAQAMDVGGAKTKLEAQIADLEDTFSRLSVRIHSVYLLDPKGQVIWSKLETPGLVALDIYSYPGIGDALKKGMPGISNLVSSPANHTPVILLSSPTRGQQGSTGALIVAIDPSRSSIGGFIQPIRLGETGYVEIVDQNGTVVARTEPGPDLAPFEKSDHAGRFAALISAGEPTRGVCHTCHESEQKVERQDVLAFTPLSKANWGVVIRQSEEEALAPTRELYQNLLLFGAGLVTVALLFVAVTTRDIGGRIRMLTAASKGIAEGDLLSPVPTSGKDEVGVLAQTLDDMRTKLKTSYGELEQKTKELSSLLSVSEILTSTFDLPQLLDAVVSKVVEVIPGADGGVLLLEAKGRNNVVVQCAVGVDKARCQSVFQEMGRANAVSELAEDQERDMVEEGVITLLQSDVLRNSVQSFIGAEVWHRNRHTGSLILASFRDAKAFSESDRSLLKAIADYIAIAIERTQLAKEAGEAKALQEADRLRSQFISSVSHELRTPLTLIKGYSTSLLRPDTRWDKETEREFLQTIDDKTDELRDLIDKLLQSAKLEAGALRLEKEPVLIPRLAERVIADLEPRTRKHKLILDFTPSFPVVEADMRCMEQVLRNLVENAIKYSPDGGDIVIAGGVKDNNLVVSVSDQGVGISLEHQEKLFERFYRVDNPHVRGTPGSGLGLSITRGHIEAHGGKVWLESIAGKGSKFYFSLPLNQSNGGD